MTGCPALLLNRMGGIFLHQKCALSNAHLVVPNLMDEEVECFAYFFILYDFSFISFQGPIPKVSAITKLNKHKLIFNRYYSLFFSSFLLRSLCFVEFEVFHELFSDNTFLK